ncbi:MAG: 16S rRNA (guanine(966)-N(2))-methyltransferase RsmD, partial [Clostridia bacterium]
MRVISGKYRGKKLLSPIGNDIRPTSDMVKESIFNVLQFDISGASFVDLFSGTGNIGIEAISRGAERVIFVDNAKSSLALIADNLKDIKEEYSIVSKDYRDALQMINSKVDYIFVDAPYQIDCIAEVCDIVDNRKILNDNGYIIYEHDKNLNVQISNKWYIKKRKKFGIVVVDYIAKTQKLCAFTGSFDPITNGHINIIEQALKDFDKVQLVIGKNAKKEYLFDLPTRLAIAKMCLSRTLNVNIDTCNGWIFEYCNQHAIDTIVRGARSDAEMPYEQEIADFNKEKGNINTVFYKAGAGFENVSSTAV